MARPLVRLLGTLQLVRFSLALGAIGDLWFAVLLARADPAASTLPVATMGLGEALAIATLVATGLFAFGTSLNDVLDVRHDSAFSPERPIPSGRVRSGQAVIVAIGALMTAVSCAVLFGRDALLTTVAVAALILFFNAAGRYFPGVGLLTVGLVHAGHMLIPDQTPALTLPAWLAMVHAIMVRATVYRLEEKRPPIGPAAVLAVTVGLAVATGLLLSRSRALEPGAWPGEISATSALWPIGAIVLFIIVARLKTRGIPPGAAAEKLLRYGSLWQVVYGVSWMAMIGQWRAAGWLLMLAVGGFAVLLLLREALSLVLRPPTYRA
ncbi:MAG: hypothetical protein KF724_02695 [Phycisphaeraceae bacterium]|nr:hypothetical protein [Phycisphaeraceae bacterium]